MRARRMDVNGDVEAWLAAARVMPVFELGDRSTLAQTAAVMMLAGIPGAAGILGWEMDVEALTQGLEQAVERGMIPCAGGTDMQRTPTIRLEFSERMKMEIQTIAAAAGFVAGMPKRLDAMMLMAPGSEELQEALAELREEAWKKRHQIAEWVEQRPAEREELERVRQGQDEEALRAFERRMRIPEGTLVFRARDEVKPAVKTGWRRIWEFITEKDFTTETRRALRRGKNSEGRSNVLPGFRSRGKQ